VPSKRWCSGGASCLYIILFDVLYSTAIFLTI
jgi:hypothetical protein